MCEVWLYASAPSPLRSSWVVGYGRSWRRLSATKTWHTSRLALRIIRPRVSSALLRHKTTLCPSSHQTCPLLPRTRFNRPGRHIAKLQSDRYIPTIRGGSISADDQGGKADFCGADQVPSPNEPLGVNPVQDECMCIVSTLSRAFRPALSFLLTSPSGLLNPPILSSEAQTKLSLAELYTDNHVAVRVSLLSSASNPPSQLRVLQSLLEPPTTKHDILTQILQIWRTTEPFRPAGRCCSLIQPAGVQRTSTILRPSTTKL